jgi:hypothetical protein
MDVVDSSDASNTTGGGSSSSRTGGGKGGNSSSSSNNAQQQQQFPALEIDSADVIRIMMQFMKENNLKDSLKALSAETGVSLNTVDSVDSFVADICQGKWESVLAQVNHLKVPKEKLASLYEQVIFELLEAGERNLAKELLALSEPMKYLKLEHPGLSNNYLLMRNDLKCVVVREIFESRAPLQEAILQCLRCVRNGHHKGEASTRDRGSLGLGSLRRATIAVAVVVGASDEVPTNSWAYP